MTPTLPKVIGENVQRLRTEHGITQAALARAARAYGLKWHDTRVSELERGTLPLSSETLLLLGFALQRATGSEITLDDLTEGDGEAALNDDVTAPLELIRSIYAGGTFTQTEGMRLEHSVEALTDYLFSLNDLEKQILGAAGKGREYFLYNRRGIPAAQTETKVLRSLNVGPTVLSALSYAAWRKTLAEERDLRASPGDSPQKRGRITRELLAELRELLERADG